MSRIPYQCCIYNFCNSFFYVMLYCADISLDISFYILVQLSSLISNKCQCYNWFNITLFVITERVKLWLGASTDFQAPYRHRISHLLFQHFHFDLPQNKRPRVTAAAANGLNFIYIYSTVFSLNNHSLLTFKWWTNVRQNTLIIASKCGKCAS